MNTRKLIFLITILSVFAMAARFSVDSDTWWHLRAGQWIWEKKSIPRVDHFSYTQRGEAWHYPGWIWEVIMLGIYSQFGAGGLNLMTAFIVALTFLFTWFTIRGNNFIKAFVVILAAAASGVYWAARPYLVTFLFTAVYLSILERERSNWQEPYAKQAGGVTHYDWLLPLLMIFWANSHGGFAVGFIIFGIYYLGLTFHVGVKNIWEFQRGKLGNFMNRVRGQDSEKRNSSRERKIQTKTSANVTQWHRYLLIGLGLIIAVCLNPYGPKMLVYPFRTVGISALQMYIEEWQSPDFHQARIMPFLILFLLTFGSVGASEKKISIGDFLLVSVFGTLALTAGRNIALFALAAPIVLMRHAVDISGHFRKGADWVGNKDQNKKMKVINGLILTIVALAVVYKSYLVYPEKNNQEYIAELFPVEAVEHIKKSEYQGHLFNSYNWGGYLIWSLREYPVFVDGRTDLYGDEIVDQWVTVVQGEKGWEQILQRWDVNLILIEPYRPIVMELNEKDWERVYQDTKSIIFKRK